VVAFERIHTNGSKSLWKTKCDCGKETISFGNNLVRGLATSCGCNHKNYCKPGAALRALYAHYKRSAELRDLSFSVAELDFEFLTSSLCHYCGHKPSQKRKAKSGEVYLYNGLDRKDNNIGYETSNCLPCCFFCNSAKRNKSYEDFSKWIKVVYLTLTGERHGKAN
jgi:hypothetical protein